MREVSRCVATSQAWRASTVADALPPQRSQLLGPAHGSAACIPGPMSQCCISPFCCQTSICTQRVRQIGNFVLQGLQLVCALARVLQASLHDHRGDGHASFRPTTLGHCIDTLPTTARRGRLVRIGPSLRVTGSFPGSFSTPFTGGYYP
jgi:hypothetical protein